jgi:hypothetical protein
MTRELPKEKREDELAADHVGQSPAKDVTDSVEPADGRQTQDAAADANANVVSEIASDVAPEFPAAEPVGNKGLPDEPTVAPTDPSPSESLGALAAAQDTSTEAPPPSNPAPAKSGGTDWSSFVPAPGYADPKTGKLRWLTGRVDQAGLELSDFVHGRRPVFEPELAEPRADSTPQPPPFAQFARDEGSPPFFPPQPNRAAAATAPVFVDVKVSLSPEDIERVTKGAIRKAAEFSRGEIMVVARKLHELFNDLKDQEVQRRAAWRHW